MNCVVLVEFQQLLQLLLKASQDKRFMCEEAERALGSMVGSMTTLPLLQKLRVSVSHKNLRIRAKAAVSLSKCGSKMVNEEMEEFGMENRLINRSIVSRKLIQYSSRSGIPNVNHSIRTPSCDLASIR
ncbi:hypothetical protein KIW84_066069 [Lathyrus oleraceus]|uniref:Uncharacterized protein n=1 Tax=Pisum sativum TaxID=3888 RepID=A0A9D4WIV6_PEA|nr:hypothetical protein KIW84_066069 [Pisum sativum]